MGLRSPCLQLLLLFIISGKCVRGEQSYIIDNVGLKILPQNMVQSGTAVTIHCMVHVSVSNMPQLVHQFKLMRDDAVIHSSNTTDDYMEYNLVPARAADSGSYQCQVSVIDKTKNSFSEKLDVTGLQTPILYLVNTEPYEGEEFKATCSAPKEKVSSYSSLIFHFYQRFLNGEPQRMKQLNSNSNSTETTLSLRHIGNCFLSCDYQISLASGTRHSNRSQEVPVLVKVLNITPVMNIIAHNPLYEGDIVEVICRVVASHLRGIEVYLKKGQTIFKKVTATALTHRFKAKADSSGELVCKAEWGNVQKESYKSITVKEVFSEPKLIMQPTELFEGDRFRLNCSVDVYFPEKVDFNSAKIIYYKDSFILPSGAVYESVASPGTNGNYSCSVEASREVHEIIYKESQTLLVKAKAPVSEPVLKVVGGTIFLGKPFQVICHSNQGTFPITYILHCPDGRTEEKVAEHPRNQAVFQMPSIYKSSDLEKCFCSAKNSQHTHTTKQSRQQLRSTTTIIEPVSRPVLTLLPDTGDISEGQGLSLICSVQRGSIPINFTWYHRETSVLHSLTINKLEASYRINNVEGKDRGTYYCASTNSAKEVKQSRHVTIGVKMAAWKKALIVVFCLLLLLALVLVIAFKTRFLHFRRKRTTNLSVKSVGTKAERLSLTQAEVVEFSNATPTIMGKSVWSDHVSGSESDDQNSTVSPERSEPQYTEVQISEADQSTVAPVKEEPDTACTEQCKSQQGVPELADGVSVEYAQLNHEDPHEDCQGDRSHLCDDTPNSEHKTETDDCVNTDTGDHGDGSCDHAGDSLI